MIDRKSIDWEAIEREYRTTQLSVREIAKYHGISHVAIIARAKKDAWQRDLSAAIRGKVTTRLVTDDVTVVVTTDQIIENATARAVQIVREHRASIGRGQRLALALFGELEEASENREEIDGAIEDETADDKNGKRREMMQRAVALPSRSSVLVNLSNALKTFVALERQAFSLDEPQPSSQPTEAEAAKITDEIRLRALVRLIEKTGGLPT